MKKSLFLLFVLFSLSALTAQEDKVRVLDLIEMNDGRVIQGKIIDETADELILISEGIEYKIDVKKISSRSKGLAVAQGKVKKIKKPYSFDLNKFSLEFGIAGLSNTVDEDGTSSYLRGHYFLNERLGVGLGVSYDQYNGLFFEELVALTAEIMGFLNRKRFSPYYGLGLGYAFPVNIPEFSDVTADGGVSINPRLGLKWGIKNNQSLSFSVGMKFQDARYSGSDFFGGGRLAEEVFFKRWQIGLNYHFHFR